jgi:ElaB/YqjD/DUF883 family membrane-anchored ribosome-binding protein
MSNTQSRAASPDIAAMGSTAIRNARAGVDEAVSNAAAMGREAAQSARDVRDTLADALLKSIRTRPYTTIAAAGIVGFLYGAMRRR